MLPLPGNGFLEIGPGGCVLSFEVAKWVKKVLAIDVSKEVTKITTSPGNFELIHIFFRLLSGIRLVGIK